MIYLDSPSCWKSSHIERPLYFGGEGDNIIAINHAYRVDPSGPQGLATSQSIILNRIPGFREYAPTLATRPHTCPSPPHIHTNNLLVVAQIEQTVCQRGRLA